LGESGIFPGPSRMKRASRTIPSLFPIGIARHNLSLSRWIRWSVQGSPGEILALLSGQAAPASTAIEKIPNDIEQVTDS
jgi:hypothetical protein